MPFLAQKSKSNYQLLTADIHPAKLFRIFDIGTQENEYKGQIKQRHRFFLSWEIPGERRKWTDDKDEEHNRPMTKDVELTYSWYMDSVLKQYMRGWSGEDYTDEQYQGVDLSLILNDPEKAIVSPYCQLQIIHKKSKDGSKTYANVHAILPWGKGAEHFHPECGDSFFTFNKTADHSEFECTAFPEYTPAWLISKAIMASEWEAWSKGVKYVFERGMIEQLSPEAKAKIMEIADRSEPTPKPAPEPTASATEAAEVDLDKADPSDSIPF